MRGIKEMNQQTINKKLCELCEKPHNNNYLCDDCQRFRMMDIRFIDLKTALKQFTGYSRKFRKYLKQDFEEIKADYPSDSFGDESFNDFLENTINATYNLED